MPFHIKVPKSAGPTITVTSGTDGSVVEHTVTNGRITVKTEDEAFRLASQIEGASLTTEEK